MHFRHKIPLENQVDDIPGGHGVMMDDLDETGNPLTLVTVDHIIASDNISEIVKVLVEIELNISKAELCNEPNL